MNTSTIEQPTATDELDEEILNVFRAAKAGLTDDDLEAVLAIRHYRGIIDALEDLVLSGELGAERIDEHEEAITLKNYRFYALSTEEKPEQTAA
jgi:hypothetical protein